MDYELDRQVRRMLSEVSDTYDFFVDGIGDAVKRDSVSQRRLIAWIKKHPEADSSDIIEYVTDVLHR